MNLDNNCPIYLESIINISNKITLDCKHSFHKECFNKYFDTTCLICKRPFMTSNISNSTFTNVIVLHNSIIKKSGFKLIVMWESDWNYINKCI